MTISLPDGTRTQSIASIKRYFSEALDQDIGELKAGLVLDFFLKAIAPSVHNAAISDAQAFLHERVADLEGVCAPLTPRGTCGDSRPERPTRARSC